MRGASAGLADAALGVAAGLALLAVQSSSGSRGACGSWVEDASLGGWTRRARCAGPERGQPIRGPARLLFGLPLDPNRADAAALESLPGVGPARARALVAARRNAPFCRTADLERVPGIGPRTRERLEDWVRVGPLPACVRD